MPSTTPSTPSGTPARRSSPRSTATSTSAWRRGCSTARDLTEAQKSIRILSGLYGLLRPLDLIQPYRLEMGTRLATERGSSLYDWWGTEVTDLVAEDLKASPAPTFR